MSGRSEESIPSPEGTAVALAVSPLPADRAQAGGKDNVVDAEFVDVGQ